MVFFFCIFQVDITPKGAEGGENYEEGSEVSYFTCPLQIETFLNDFNLFICPTGGIRYERRG